MLITSDWVKEDEKSPGTLFCWHEESVKKPKRVPMYIFDFDHLLLLPPVICLKFSGYVYVCFARVTCIPLLLGSIPTTGLPNHPTLPGTLALGHSGTWALGQAEPILDLHNVHLCPSPGPSPSTPSNLTFLKTFHTVYNVNASDLQSWSDPDARRCLFRKPAWSRLLSEVSVFVTWLWFFAFATWQYWAMSEFRNRFVIFSSGTHCNEPHVQSDLFNNTQQNSSWTLSLTILQMTRCLPGRGDKTLRTESCIIVPMKLWLFLSASSLLTTKGYSIPDNCTLNEPASSTRWVKFF